jgi:hypothetical protein
MNDYRQSAFNVKFATAAKTLGVTPEKIVSLKIRDCVGSYDVYRDMVHSLEQEFGFQSSPVTGELQGRGYLLTKDKAHVIVVEHETGLEILYIAGSIASLIALIPIVLQAWGAIRRFADPRNPFQKVEVRKLNENGELQEDNILLNHLSVGNASNLALTAAASLLEGEFQELNRKLESLSPRILELEQRLAKLEDGPKRKRGSRSNPKRNKS